MQFIKRNELLVYVCELIHVVIPKLSDENSRVRSFI